MTSEAKTSLHESDRGSVWNWQRRIRSYFTCGDQGSKGPLFLLAIICAGSIVLRLYGLEQTWLWYDEIYGATFATQSLFDATIAAARFDIHPPLWIQQLHLWSWFGQSDQWLLANSVCWSLISVLSVYWTTRRVYGIRVAMLAALFLAVMPISVAYSRQLRMYSMLMAVIVWAWYLNHRILSGSSSRRMLITAALCELVISYSHGIGILINACLGGYGVLLRLNGAAQPAIFRRWLKAQAVVAVLSLGAVANALVRSVTHTKVPDLNVIKSTFSDYWFGPGWVESPITGWAGLAICAVLSGSILLSRRGRSTLLALWLGPILLTFVIGILFRPIWHLHAILFTVPFAAIAGGIAIDNLSARRKRMGRFCAEGLTGSLIAVFLAFSIHHVLAFKKQTNYRWAANEIHREAGPSDMVFVPEPPDFWGVARYAIGPEWGSPLKVQPRESCEDRWCQILEAIGPVWRQRLHLEPEADYIVSDDVRFVIGEPAGNVMAHGTPQQLLVVRSRSSEIDDLAGYVQKSVQRRGNIHVLVYERDADLTEDVRQFDHLANRSLP